MDGELDIEIVGDNKISYTATCAGEYLNESGDRILVISSFDLDEEAVEKEQEPIGWR